MSKEQAQDLLPRKDATDTNNARWWNEKPEREANVSGLRVVEPDNDQFTAKVEY